MALQFTTTNMIGLNSINVLIYGRPGTGKTVMCSTAPGPLILAAERGLLSISNKKVPVAIINSLADLTEAFDWVSINGKSSGIKTVCVDSVSEITEKCLAMERKKSNDPRLAYGNMSMNVIELMKKFIANDSFDTVFTAKEKTEIHPITGVEMAAPDTDGKKVAHELPYAFDGVYHMEIGVNQQHQTVHYVRAKSSVKCDAKDRSGVLDEFEPPDLTFIFDKIRKAKSA